MRGALAAIFLTALFGCAGSLFSAEPVDPKRSERSATQAFEPVGQDGSAPQSNPIEGSGSGSLRGFRAEAAGDSTTVFVVVGVAGDEQYGTVFDEEAGRWEKICADTKIHCVAIGQATTGPMSDRDRLQRALAAEPKTGDGKLWIVLIGHGTFDGQEAKFNLRGPDFTATELGQWLQPFHRPLAIIDTSSASAPFLNKLSGPGRVIVTATRSGDEQNYARFGTYLAAALTDPQSDLDRDGQVSLLEAFLSASARLAEFYKTAGRLATEHPLIDDNGDGLGTPPDWFQGVRAVKRAKDGAAPDGPLAEQFVLVPSLEEQKLPLAVRVERDRIELQVAKLREQKAKLAADDYYAQLEALMLQLAKLYAK